MPSRCFIAVDVSDSVRRTLEDARRTLVAADATWGDQRWVAPGLLHVTLKFIGPLPDESVPDLLDGVRGAVAGEPFLAWQLAGIRAVPDRRRASMLWATLSGDQEAATRLHAIVEETLADRLGVEMDTRRYTPHITLVRTRRPHRVAPESIEASGTIVSEAGKVGDGFVSVRSLTLYASTLGAAGPTYQVIGEVPVGSRPARRARLTPNVCSYRLGR